MSRKKGFEVVALAQVSCARGLRTRLAPVWGCAKLNTAVNFYIR